MSPQKSLCLLLLLGLLLPGCVEEVKRKPPRVAPDFSLMGLDGRARRLSDFRGRAVLLHFDAPDSPYAASEAAQLSGIQARWRGRGGQVLWIDMGEGLDQARRDFLAHPVPFPVLADPDSRAAALYAPRGAARRLGAEDAMVGANALVAPDGRLAATRLLSVGGMRRDLDWMDGRMAAMLKSGAARAWQVGPRQVAPGGTVELREKVVVRPWMILARDGGGLAPLSLESSGDGQLQVEGTQVPDGSLEQVEGVGGPVDALSGAFIVVVEVQASPLARPGWHSLGAVLNYQACDRAGCLDPASLPVTLRINVFRPRSAPSRPRA